MGVVDPSELRDLLLSTDGNTIINLLHTQYYDEFCDGWQEDIFPKNDRGEVADIYMSNNFVIDGHNTFCPVLLKLVNV